MDKDELRRIIEAVLLAEDTPLTVDRLLSLFEKEEQPPEKADIRDAIKALEEHIAESAMELRQVATGWRLQVRRDYAPWVSKLWREKPARYSRAFLETLALIVYRQPITRGDIEDVRGVSVSQNIMRTLQERGWIREIGQREVPGRPTLFGTTRQFLDDFDLKSLDQLPALPEIKDLEALHAALEKLAPGTMTAEELAQLTSQETEDDSNLELNLGANNEAGDAKTESVNADTTHTDAEDLPREAESVAAAPVDDDAADNNAINDDVTNASATAEAAR